MGCLQIKRQLEWPEARIRCKRANREVESEREKKKEEKEKEKEKKTRRRKRLHQKGAKTPRGSTCRLISALSCMYCYQFSRVWHAHELSGVGNKRWKRRKRKRIRKEREWTETKRHVLANVEVIVGIITLLFFLASASGVIDSLAYNQWSWTTMGLQSRKALHSLLRILKLLAAFETIN